MICVCYLRDSKCHVIVDILQMWHRSEKFGDHIGLNHIGLNNHCNPDSSYQNLLSQYVKIQTIDNVSKEEVLWTVQVAVTTEDRSIVSRKAYLGTAVKSETSYNLWSRSISQ